MNAVGVDRIADQSGPRSNGCANVRTRRLTVIIRCLLGLHPAWEEIDRIGRVVTLRCGWCDKTHVRIIDGPPGGPR